LAAGFRRWRSGRRAVGQVGVAPAASQRLHEIHGGREASGQDVVGDLFVGKRQGLGGNHLEVCGDPGRIAVPGERQRSLRRLDRRGLLGSLLGQYSQRREIVFDVLECGESLQAIHGHRGVVGCPCLFGRGTTLSGVKERRGQLRPDRPETARYREPGRELGALVAAGRRQQQLWKVSGNRDTDLRVRRRDAALRRGDVGSALEKLRRKAGRNVGRHRDARHGLDREFRGRLADESADRVLELGAEDSEVRGLRARRFELRLGLGHVDAGDDSLVVSIERQLQGLFVRRDVGIQKLFLRVLTAEQEIVGRELRVHRQPHGLQVSGRRLRRGDAALDVAADASPDVDLIRDVDRQLI
jgi:ribosomal protein L34E